MQRDVIFMSIMDDLIDNHRNDTPLYIGTLEDRLDPYDPESRIGCYVVVSEIDASANMVRMGRVLVSEHPRAASMNDDDPARQIMYRCANLTEEYALQTHPGMNVCRGMVGILSALVWPTASVRFMQRNSSGQWVPKHEFEE